MAKVPKVRLRDVRNQIYTCYQSCAYCDKPLTSESATLDHVVPLSRGGTSRLENIVLSCGDCNHEKSDHLLVEFMFRERSERMSIAQRRNLERQGCFPRMRNRTVTRKARAELAYRVAYNSLNAATGETGCYLHLGDMVAVSPVLTFPKLLGWMQHNGFEEIPGMLFGVRKKREGSG